MKRKQLLIIAGVTLIFIVLGIWVYLLLFSNGSDDGQFADLETNTDPFVVDDDPSEEDEFSATDDNAFLIGVDRRLRQLTTRDVAGAAFIENGVRFVEKGTGHIYDIDFTTFSEQLISGTTIARTTKAHFSKSGNRVLIMSEGNDATTISVTSLSKNDVGDITLNGINLPRGAHNADFNVLETEVFYVMREDDASVGFAYHIFEGTNRQLFDIPLRDVQVIWGEEIYLYTSPSYESIGHVYKLVDNTLEFVTSGGQGLTAFTYGSGVITTLFAPGEPISTAYQDNQELPVSVPVFTEKCVASVFEPGTIFCATPNEGAIEKYPDNWYKGLESYTDGIWRVEADKRIGKALIDLKAESGREIDVHQIALSEDETKIIMVNKNDDGLWLFDLRL